MKRRFLSVLLRLAPLSIGQSASMGFLILVIPFIFRNSSELDFFWHILIGQDILQNWRFGGPNDWTWARSDENWTTTQPLAEIIMYTIWWLGGEVLVSFLRLSLCLFLIFQIYHQMFYSFYHMLGSNLLKISTLLTFALSTIFIVGFVQERPNSITLLFTCLSGVWLKNILNVNQKVPFKSIYIIFLFWPFIHGGWILSYLVIFSSMVLRSLLEGYLKNEWKKVLPFFFFGIWTPLLTLLTPSGTEYFKNALQIAKLGRQFIREWQGLSLKYEAFTMAMFCIFISTTLIVLLHRIINSNSKKSKLILIWKLLIFSILVVISFYSVRNIVITILLTVFSIYSFDGDREGRNAASKRNFSQEVKNLNLVFVIGLSLCLGISVLQSLNADILDKEKRPVKIYDLLARDEKERVFLNSANEGGELLYFTKGKTKVYMDGRVDRYPISVHTESAILFSQTPGWKKLALELLPCATDMLVSERLPIVGFAQTVGYKLIIKDSGFAWLSRASEASPGRNCRR